MEKIVFSLLLVITGISLGYTIQRLVHSGTIIVKNNDLGPIRKRLQQIALLVLNPIAIAGATWIADIRNLQIFSLPLLCITALFTGGLITLFVSKLFKMKDEQTGAYVVCGAFTNIGSLGALFCFIFLGEEGFALVPLYKLFEELCYYGFGFPIAKSYSRQSSNKENSSTILRSVITDPFVLIAITAITLGFSLNLIGVTRPTFYTTINSLFIPTAAFLLLLSIGMGMRFSSIKHYFRPSLCIAFIKFCCVPLIIGCLGYLCGLHNINNGLPLKVIIILSSMPTGFIAMIPPTLYNLDTDLANSCWLTTNFLLLLQLPLLFFVINLI